MILNSEGNVATVSLKLTREVTEKDHVYDVTDNFKRREENWQIVERRSTALNPE